MPTTTYDTEGSLDDRAHVLSQINMYHGRTPYPYSVAQGAVLRSYLASRKHALASFTEFAQGEWRDWTGDEYPSSAPARDANRRAMRFEEAILIGGDGAAASITGLPLGQLSHLREVVKLLKPMHPRRAAAAYVARYLELTGEKTGDE